MKKVEAIIKPFKLEEVKDALAEVGLEAEDVLLVLRDLFLAAGDLGRELFDGYFFLGDYVHRAADFGVQIADHLLGTFDLEVDGHGLFDGRWNDDFYFSSPLHYLPALPDGDQLGTLRHRFVLLATGSGRWEDAGQSRRLADVLGSKGIPNRVDDWGSRYDHDWQTWHEMLPKYLGELG
jgi:esterase/lipase superfamily enzyme